MSDPEITELCKRLAEPFEPSELQYKPQKVNGNRAVAVTYVDARLIQDRLDEVVGSENWEDDYTVLDNGSVLCRLTVRFGDRTITKCDVGSPSEQSDAGDRTKAAFSDALKRAAVKFGIGRYLYRLPATWVDYDPQKRRIVAPPRLPDWALPKRGKKATEAKTSTSAHSCPQVPTETPTNAHQRPPAQNGKEKGNGTPLPASGKDLQDRILRFDQSLAVRGFIEPGQLEVAIKQFGRQQKFPESMDSWSEKEITEAVAESKRFQEQVCERKSKAYRDTVKALFGAKNDKEFEAEVAQLNEKGSKGFEAGEWDILWDIIERRREEMDEAAGRQG